MTNNKSVPSPDKSVPSLVCCQRLAKALKAVGVEMETEKWWCKTGGGFTEPETFGVYILESYSPNKRYPAPMLHETLEVLPKEIDTKIGKAILTLDYTGVGLPRIEYRRLQGGGVYTKGHKSPAEAATLLVITLCEEGIIKGK